MKKVELLAPVGSYNKLETALYFGADAVYLAGKEFGLRAFAENFTQEEMKKAVEKTHKMGKKIYVTVNIFANNRDFDKLKDYLIFLSGLKVDAVIVSDAGIISFIRKNFPDLDIHLSTQANTTNKYAVAFWRDIGVKRVVLARELSLEEIREIYDYVGDSVELEAFVHGAMCISYSGRCLLSNYLSDRDSNKGECVQACRWEYVIHEIGKKDKPLMLEQDKRGSYILNSRDLNTISILDKIIESGISSLKIEGRVKSEYYAGTVVNAYRKRLNDIYKGKPFDIRYAQELEKVGHRLYTQGFYLGKEAEVSLHSSLLPNDYIFCVEVLGYDKEKKCIIAEQRNRFYAGDTLEIISPRNDGNIIADEIYDEEGNNVYDCKIVQQTLYIKSEIKLAKHDMLRKFCGGDNAK